MFSMPAVSEPAAEKEPSRPKDPSLALRTGGPLMISFDNRSMLIVGKDAQGGGGFNYESKNLVLTYGDSDGRLLIQVIKPDGSRVILIDSDGDMIPDVRRTLDKDSNQLSVERLKIEKVEQ
jgi:hypothetical protein